MDSQLSWPDVNCASRLCFKGMCKHKLKQGAGLTDDWLCQHVTPHITMAFGKSAGRIFALPLLWASFSDVFAERVQPEIRSRICGQFVRLEREGFEDGVNPVEKVEVIPNESTHEREHLKRAPLATHHSLTLFFAQSQAPSLWMR